MWDAAKAVPYGKFIALNAYTRKEDRSQINNPSPGTSLVAQWLRIACQCRGHEFDPWSRKTPRAREQLSPCATTTEPVL